MEATALFGYIGLLCIFITIIIGLLLSYIGSLISMKAGAPFVPSFKKDLKVLKKLELEKNKKILDLGCGNWKALRFFKKNFNIQKWVGYDVNFAAIIQWKLINKFKWIKNINLNKKNFKKANLKEYKYIYIYLFPELLEKIEDWLFENISQNTIIISNSFEFDNRKAFRILTNQDNKDKIYMYKKN